jgi:hypothetical protein
MKREVVQDFLNLPGITGLALMDGRSRPYFCGVDRSLNFQQKEALAQGIQQVIDTTPANFDFFEFQFSGHQVYIYKLRHGIILLVLTIETLSHTAYAEVVERLKAELQQDVTNTIATFRLLAGSTTLSGQNYWKQDRDSKSYANSPPQSTSPTELIPKSSPSNLATPSANGIQTPSHSTQIPSQPPPPATPAPPASAPPREPPAPSTTLKEVVAAMNHLSQYATQYLGPMVVANYWKASRPKVDWLVSFNVERSAQISTPDISAPLTAEQHQWLRDWVAAFIDRCAKVIRDFPKSVRNAALNEQQKSLLLTD